MPIDRIYVSALGTFLPPSASVALAVKEGLYPVDSAENHELTGVAVAGPIPAPEMARRAAEAALQRLDQGADKVELLLYASTWLQGPDGWSAPAYLQRHLLGAVPAVEIRQGCNGMFAALMMGADYLRADSSRRGVLLTAADNFGTPLVDRWRMGEDYIAGDAASAVVVTRTPGFAELMTVCSTAVPEAEELTRGREPLFPPGLSVGRNTDFAARMRDIRAMLSTTPNQQLTQAMEDVAHRIPQLVDRALGQAGMTHGDISRVAVVNRSREVTKQRWLDALGFPMSMSTWDFGRNIGHCGASDHILALEHLIKSGQLGPGDSLLMLGIAPAITLSAAIVTIRHQPAWATN